MRIGIVGKFPPIQGGVSMRTYWVAHGLGALGHDVHLVTNAKEAQPPFRIYMQAADWSRCEALYDAGSVTVHWTDPADDSQSYIPMASAFVSKLAGLAARIHAVHPFDVIYSHYMEPYGVAGHLAAEMAGVPHVTRLAGSDGGRLWRHPQLEILYDHVLRSAAVMIARGPVGRRALQRGVAFDRIAVDDAFAVPEHVFTPEGPVLDLYALRAAIAGAPDFKDLMWGEFVGDRPYFGVYGKLGESKGSFVLLEAIARLRSLGLDIGLVALAHGEPAVERRWRDEVRRLGLAASVLQLPFLPHWRVPEFLRGCLAVCCLEQDFPIRAHAPILPREVLLCGRCLVASTEVIRKIPSHARLASGYSCVAIENVQDVVVLSENLAAIAATPHLAAAVGAQGRAFASELQRGSAFPRALERILQGAAARKRLPADLLRWSDGPPCELGVSTPAPASAHANSSKRPEQPALFVGLAAVGHE